MHDHDEGSNGYVSARTRTLLALAGWVVVGGASVGSLLWTLLTRPPH